MIRASFAVLFALVVLACDPPVTSGIVTSREHQDAYVTYYQQCYSYDPKTGACTLSLPSSTYYPDEWDLCLRDDHVDKPANQQPAGCVEVAESEWATYHVGDHFPRPR